MKPQKSVIITIGSKDQENTRDTRRTFKNLQRDAHDKENLTGRPPAGKDVKIFSDSGSIESKKKKLQMLDKSTQAGQSIVEDLTSQEPSLEYWKKLAETRGQSLDDSLHEIEKLKDNIYELKEENKICKEMLDESKHLVEVLQEMLNEPEDEESQETISNHQEI